MDLCAQRHVHALKEQKEKLNKNGNHMVIQLLNLDETVAHKTKK